jgi:hypothetical protein
MIGLRQLESAGVIGRALDAVDVGITEAGDGHTVARYDIARKTLALTLGLNGMPLDVVIEHDDATHERAMRVAVTAAFPGLPEGMGADEADRRVRVAITAYLRAMRP